MKKTEKPIIQTSKIDICRNCNGTGKKIDDSIKFTWDDCNVCEGKGRVNVKKEIKITIETL